ncbi:hypothetical protein Pan241w_12490 [Gimesia alba]|uniref:IncA protein n=1 Tax=Gimesia alba TaxID=2527973 RepID=A0A517RBD2_9PLAN|nr:hypothetical protein [Gimesia alba]QDT41189.1 hypothetical protein Pan241w_12490 [Gimesia alba]
MSRQGREARSVSLFPFLAVLICAMGALIFLLVVTTRRIRHQALMQVQQVVVEEVVEDDLYPPVLFAAEVVEPEPAAPIITKVQEPEPVPEPEPKVINLALEKEARLNALNREKAKKLAALKLQNQNLIRLKNELSQSEAVLNQSKQQIQSLQEKDSELSQKMVQLKDQKLRVAELLQEELRTLQQKKQSQQTARSKYSIITYDGQTGTAKRPILIECTDKGLTFLPEGITLTPDDLKEFTPGYNPLLAGTQALFQYWKTKDGRTDQEPYVLILVRPSGSVGYYVARKLLNNLDLDSGYELIDADWDFALPEKDPNAEQVCQSAIDRVLRERKNLVSQLRQNSQPGPGGRRLQFDARTGTVRVIEPEEEAGTGTGASRGSGQLATGNTGNASAGSRFSDVLTPRQQMARAEHLRSVANQKHIVSKEGTGSNESEKYGQGAGAGREESRQRTTGLKSLPGSRQGAEVYDLADLKEPKGWSGERDSSLKQAKVIGRDQLKEMAEQHLVPLDAAQGKQFTNARDPHGTGQEESGTAPNSSQNGMVENPFLKKGSQAGTGRSDQQSQNAASQPRLERIPPGRSASGAGNATTLSLNRNRRSGASSTIESSNNSRWQPAQSRSGIGFEREITVQVGADQILVGGEKAIRVDQGVTQEQLLQSMIVVMDQYVESWGPAPKGFYWVPTIQFTISPGGNQYYERLKSSAQKMGLQTEAKYTLDPLPVSSSPLSGKGQ